MIPAYGMWIVVSALIGIGVLWLIGLIEDKHAAIYAGAVGAMGLLGFLDDVFGSREVGGFRGHFKELVFQRRLTTGGVKALGGGIVAVAIGASISRGDVLQLVLAAGLVALSANTLNLLDLRPGRASAAFFAGMATAILAAGFRVVSPWAVAAVVVPTIIGYWWDRNARAMMGDAGSNALGAVIGVTFAMSGPIWAQAAFLTLLLLLNIYSEKRSITEALERHPFLNGIDRLTGVR